MLERINALVWGLPLVAGILGVGLYLTWITGGVQLRLLPESLRALARSWKGEDGEGSSFRALCTALGATVGTGNIAGVAGAIAIGGPGAVFWMWVSGFVGMATKYAEAACAVASSKEGRSGTMYMIERGMGKRFRPLAVAYCVFGVLASFGVGNAAQIDAVMDALFAGSEPNSRTVWILSIFAAVLVFAMVSGGAPKIGAAAELLIPAASGVYVVLCLGVVVMGFDRVGEALIRIIQGAFSPAAVTGGIVGSVPLCLRIGISRGVFTNEAGMGTAAMAHGTARVSHPARQGLMGIMEVFLDTMVICTLTAFAILVSGVEIPYGTAAGSALTAKALESVWGGWVVTALTGCLCAFAFATILGWSLYAGRCMEYLFGKINWPVFALAQGFCVVLAAKLGGSGVWTLSELFNGLMAIPNLICLISLSPKIKSLTKDFYTGLSG